MISEESNVAKRWVEEHFPDVSGPSKAILILVYGAGMDRGIAEAEEIAGAPLAKAARDDG